MKLFWSNNSVDILKIALGTVLEHYGGRIPPSFHGISLPQDPASVQLLRGEWGEEEFAVAYIFWAFAKGYQYAASLGSEHTYVVHWLRERAMEEGVELRNLDEPPHWGLFPWGVLLPELVQHPNFHFDREVITEGMINLRNYTSDEPPGATDIANLNQFALQGLVQCLPQELGVRDYYLPLMNGVKLTLEIGLLAYIHDPVILAKLTAANIGVRLIDAFFKDELGRIINPAGRRLTLLSYRSTLKQIVKRHEPELTEYLRRRRLQR